MPAPFTLTAGAGPDGSPQVWRTARGGKLTVPVKIARAAGFAGGVRLRPVGLHPQMRSQETNVDGGAAEKTVDIDVDGTAPTGSFTFVLRGDTQVKYQRSPEVGQQAADDKKRIDAVAQQAQQDSQKAAQARQQAQNAFQQSEAQFNQAEQQRAQAEQQSEQAKQQLAEAESRAAEAKAAYDAAAAKAKEAADAAAAAATAQQQAAAGTDDAAKQAAAQAAATATAAATQAKQQADQAKVLMDQAAQKATAEATQAKTAADALAKRVEAKATAEQRMKEAEVAKQQTMEAAEKAQEFTRKAEVVRRHAEEWFREAREFSQPRDVRVVFPSTPVKVEIVPAPFTLTLAPAPGPTVKAGGEPVEFSATIVPDFGFADEVRFDLVPPQGSGSMGLADKGNLLAKGTTQAKLLLQVGQGVKPGEYACRVRARYRFNGRDLSIEEPLRVTVTPADEKK
jgi:hypothetical protein